MASTYSPSLRIELIGAGEQAGTWNTTTNTNLGTLLESAIAGYVAVSVTSANQAFTASDGAADQARNAVIALTTSTSAPFAVYAPPQEKTYIIYNTTAYTATIYNSTVLGNTTASGLGVAVSAGGKVVVFSDGTNFRTIDATSFSGVLSVVNGGTGVTTSTGTGNTVLSTSPTLSSPTLTTPTMTAPVLGTPTSGTLDNCTSNTETFGTNNTQLATTAFVQAAIAGAATFPSGTAVLFAQTAAPTGFTKSLTHDNKALRVVTGSASSGGTSAFTAVFTNQTPTITTSGLSAGATTLTTAQIPSHSHVLTDEACGGPAGGKTQVGGGCGATANTGLTGGGGSHTHTLSGTATSSVITLDVQYVDVIIATKD
jgi:hypothetical protein